MKWSETTRYFSKWDSKGTEKTFFIAQIFSEFEFIVETSTGFVEENFRVSSYTRKFLNGSILELSPAQWLLRYRCRSALRLPPPNGSHATPPVYGSGCRSLSMLGLWMKYSFKLLYWSAGGYEQYRKLLLTSLVCLDKNSNYRWRELRWGCGRRVVVAEGATNWGGVGRMMGNGVQGGELRLQVWEWERQWPDSYADVHTNTLTHQGHFNRRWTFQGWSDWYSSRYNSMKATIGTRNRNFRSWIYLWDISIKCLNYIYQ